jgi:hypothetical protein
MTDPKGRICAKYEMLFPRDKRDTFTRRRCFKWEASASHCPLLAVSGENIIESSKPMSFAFDPDQ